MRIQTVGGKALAVQTFAAIYIGSYEVSIKIFEITSKKIHKVDHLRSRLELGRDVYRSGSIGYQLVDELCEILKEFSRVMKEYGVSHYEAYASVIFHSASNELFLLDQIRLRTGIEVQVLSNSEHRFISYKSVAGRPEFEEIIAQSAAFVDIGGASMQITLFKKGNLITTQQLEMGTIRMRELLADRGKTLAQYQNQLEEYIQKKLETLMQLYLKENVAYVVLMGDYCTELMKNVAKDDARECVVKGEKLIKYISKLQKKTIQEISKELNLSNRNDPLIIPSMILCKVLVSNFGGEKVWIPGLNIHDGIAYDYAYKNKIIKGHHDFDQDVLSAARHLSEHYGSYSEHLNALQDIAGQIFDAMKRIHGLSKRERLLLQVAAILHDCGKYVSFVNSPGMAYHIVMASEIIGLSHRERQIVALTILYNNNELDDYEDISVELDQEGYLIIAKLAAILRVANALDQSHKQKFKRLRIALKERELVCTVESLEDISLEQALFTSKTKFFENVYSIKPVLKEKRVYLVE